MSFFNSLVNFFIKGGPFMAILVLLSILSIAVILQRMTVLKKKLLFPSALINLTNSIKSRDVNFSLEEISKKALEFQSLLGHILLSILEYKNMPRNTIIENIEIVGRHEISKLESGLLFIEITTGIAPLLGLLGTLSGLVHIFSNVGGDPQLVANGISEALNCTIVGLAVALPNLIAYNYFTRHIELINIQLESVSMILISKIEQTKLTHNVEQL